jgi:hypothetical protein
MVGFLGDGVVFTCGGRSKGGAGGEGGKARSGALLQAEYLEEMSLEYFNLRCVLVYNRCVTKVVATVEKGG